MPARKFARNVSVGRPMIIARIQINSPPRVALQIIGHAQTRPDPRSPGDRRTRPTASRAVSWGRIDHDIREGIVGIRTSRVGGNSRYMTRLVIVAIACLVVVFEADISSLQ